MKNAQGYGRRFLGHWFILAAGVTVCVAGCSGSASTPEATEPATNAVGSPTTEPLTPPGGMELPSDIDVSDLSNSKTSTSSPESSGSSFELPE